MASISRLLGLTATTEVMVVEGKQKRMDIVITLPTCRVWIDVSIINPLAPSYLRHKDPKTSREKAKTSNWGVHAEQRGVEFIPFIADVYGGIGEQAKKWLGQSSSRQKHGRHNQQRHHTRHMARSV